jgi:hypothetical protein
MMRSAMTDTAVPRPAASGTHADEAVFRNAKPWEPVDDDTISALPSELVAARDRRHERIEAVQQARARLSSVQSEHHRHEAQRREAMNAQARGEEVEVPKPLPGAPAAQERADAQARVDAAVVALDEHVGSELALIDAHRQAWSERFMARVAAKLEASDDLERQARERYDEAVREFMRVEWVEGATDWHSRAQWAALVTESREVLDRRMRRRTGRLSAEDRLA